MSVRFVLGRAGSGKTRLCVDEFAAALQQPRRGRLALLVPEQAAFQMERALVERSSAGGYWRADVLSFSRLAQRILDETGRPERLLTPTARMMALRACAARNPALLHAFGPAAATRGFFAELSLVIDELFAAEIDAARLREVAASLDDPSARGRVLGLAAVFDAYLNWLSSERVDAAQALDLVCDRFERVPWLRGARFWIDGFARFGAQEQRVIVALARLAQDVTITLLLDPAAPAVLQPQTRVDPLDLFATTECTYQSLRRALLNAGVSVDPPVTLTPAPAPRFRDAPTLARLEAALARPIGVGPQPTQADSAAGRGDAPGETPPAVRVLRCATPREELRQAARQIRQQIVDSAGRLRFRDFALVARGLEPFAALVEDVFREFGIPYFLDLRRSLRPHALSRFIDALARLVQTGFAAPASLRLLRTGLLPLTARQAERFENRVVEFELSGRAAWQTPAWPPTRAEKRGQRELSDVQRAERQREEQELSAARRRIVAAVEPLVELAARTTPPAAREWAATLLAVLESLGVRRRMEEWMIEARRAGELESAEVHRMAWEALCESLDDLHEILADAPLSLADVSAVLGTALAESTVGLAPPALDQVLVGSIERTRHPDVRYVWLFGFNDGVFPAAPPADRLLSAELRAALAERGLEALGSRRDDVFAERLLAYIAVTRPSIALTLSFADAGLDGQPLFPSPLLDEFRRAAGVDVETPDEAEPPVCLAEAADACLRARSGADCDETFARRALALRTELLADPRLGDEFRLRLRGVEYANRPSPVGNFRRPDDREGVEWIASPSEVEKYLSCPFRHFLLRGVKLDEQRGPTPLAVELGSRAHELLADVTRSAMALNKPIGSIDDDTWLEWLRAACERADAARSADAPGPRVRFLAAVMQAQLRETVLALAERWRRGAFRPVLVEDRFAAAPRAPGELGPALPALRLELDDGRAFRVEGQIDRVDEAQSDGRRRVLVYDYKSTVNAVRKPYLTDDRLEVFTYLLALLAADPRDGGALPAGVFLFPTYPNIEALRPVADGEADERTLRLRLFKPRGVLDRDVARLLDRDLGETPSPIAQMRLKKDGSFNKNESKDVVDARQLREYLDLARDTLTAAARGVCEGRIDVSPLIEGRRLACLDCSFQPVCRFEFAYNDARPAEVALPALNAGADEGEKPA